MIEMFQLAAHRKSTQQQVSPHLRRHHFLRNMLWPLLILSTSAFACLSTLQEEANGTVIVHTEDGTLRGQVLTSFWGRDYYAFQKIPYAQPPTGDLRFKSPRPVQKWTGVKDALDQGPYCPQAKITYTNSSMSEDCLYLNVFIPKKLNDSSSNKNLTVVFWIFGGAFVNGSGIRDVRGPDNFMNLTSILVTFNHRLGALGFLSLEHPNVTTNAGMKDQVLALRWVQRNIASFGGNPADVTIFGQSSGGMSVELLLISPVSRRGLFHRTIADSGTSLAYRTDYNGTRGAYRLAEVLGHNATSRDDLVQFLRSVPAEDLVAAQTVAATEADGITVALSLTPTVEPAVEEGDEVFLPDTPENLLRAGEFNPLPSIIGVNLLETRDSAVTDAELMRYFNDTEYVVPSKLNLKKGSNESVTLAAQIRKFYFGDNPISYDTLPQLFDLISDYRIYTVYRSIELRLARSSSPIYMYYFVYNGTLHFQTNKYTIAIGPGHVDELPYLFYFKSFPYEPSSDDVMMISRMTDMWVDFAETGDPSLRQPVKWIPTNQAEHTYLEIDLQLSLRYNFLKERMAFWDMVYATYER